MKIEKVLWPRNRRLRWNWVTVGMSPPKTWFIHGCLWTVLPFPGKISYVGIKFKRFSLANEILNKVTANLSVLDAMWWIIQLNPVQSTCSNPGSEGKQLLEKRGESKSAGKSGTWLLRGWRKISLLSLPKWGGSATRADAAWTATRRIHVSEHRVSDAKTAYYSTRIREMDFMSLPGRLTVSNASVIKSY